MSTGQFLKLKRNAIQKRLEGLTKLEATTGAFLNRTIYPLYQRLQSERFKTENRSEGQRWKPVSRQTRERKLKDRARDRAAFPGGDRILIHTGDLSRSVIGTSLEHHRKVVTGKKITVATTLGYAGFVAADRPFMKWGKDSRKEFRDRVRAYWLSYLKDVKKAGLK